jgi:hypothetical protein
VELEKNLKNYVILKMMNPREIEYLEKNSIYSIHINDEIKDSVIVNYMNQLDRVIKREKKKKKLIILVISN